MYILISRQHTALTRYRTYTYKQSLEQKLHTEKIRNVFFLLLLVVNVNQLDTEYLNQEFFLYESKIIVYKPFKFIFKVFVEIFKLLVFENNINS